MPYVVAQVLGGIVGAGVLYLIASGRTDFSLAAGFASNGYAAHSPGMYSLTAGLVCEVVLTFMFLLVILGTTRTMPVGAAMTLRIGADRTPLVLRLSTQASGIERLVSLAQQQNLGAATPDATLIALVERLAHSLADELKGRNLAVSAGPATVTRGPSRRPVGLLDAEHGLALEFDVPNDKLSLRVTRRGCHEEKRPQSRR